MQIIKYKRLREPHQLLKLRKEPALKVRKRGRFGSCRTEQIGWNRSDAMAGVPMRKALGIFIWVYRLMGKSVNRKNSKTHEPIDQLTHQPIKGGINYEKNFKQTGAKEH
ncbi:TPA: hypothetical protein DDW69_00050 [candidate division CPR2 bacterium]|nr:MAG: hypothetical protein A2Y26_03285 [candidate division CPR2 bacterium GWD2_39_7]HBG81218.1 hypothetical protein [candidate division CPR2 bacterium]HCL99749.1 hypothetical protein [candidate division CPR2 bacterium]